MDGDVVSKNTRIPPFCGVGASGKCPKTADHQLYFKKYFIKYFCFVCCFRRFSHWGRPNMGVLTPLGHYKSSDNLFE
jgi:hypothetical protein